VRAGRLVQQRRDFFRLHAILRDIGTLPVQQAPGQSRPQANPLRFQRNTRAEGDAAVRMAAARAGNRTAM